MGVVVLRLLVVVVVVVLVVEVGVVVLAAELGVVGVLLLLFHPLVTGVSVRTLNFRGAGDRKESVADLRSLLVVLLLFDGTSNRTPLT